MVCMHQIVERCEQCQSDLRSVPARWAERRQVVEMPPARLMIQEHHSEQKYCPHCQQITVASFAAEVRAPVQDGPRIASEPGHWLLDAIVVCPSFLSSQLDPLLAG